MDKNTKDILEKQHYFIAGEHAGAKMCHWVQQKLLYGRCCYKELFYGIESHRCLQMAPVINECTKSCLYCWRYQGFESTDGAVNASRKKEKSGASEDETNESPIKKYDTPEFILEECLAGQKKLVSGFKGDPRCAKKMWEESRNPTNVAISLSGEPLLYPKLGEFVALCKKKGMTTFLVTNGTCPKALAKLDPLPTQLYVSIDAPNKKIYEKMCNPKIPRAWELVQETLELLPSLDTRTVIRHTLVDEWNICDVADYAKMDKIANPMFIEPKAYVFVGYSRQRMNLSNMPPHDKVKAFAQELAGLTGYKFVADERFSRVALLARDDAAEKARMLKKSR